MRFKKKTLLTALSLSSAVFLVGCGGGGSTSAIPNEVDPVLITDTTPGSMYQDENGRIDESSFANIQSQSGGSHYDAVRELGGAQGSPASVELVSYRVEYGSADYMAADAYELQFYDENGSLVDVYAVESEATRTYIGTDYYVVNDVNNGQMILQDHDNTVLPNDIISYGIWNESPDGAFDGSRGAFAVGDTPPLVDSGLIQSASFTGGIIGQEVDGNNAQVAIFEGDVEFDANFSTNQITNFSVSGVTAYNPNDTSFSNGSPTSSYDMTGSNISISQDAIGLKFSGDVGNGADLSGKTVGRFYGENSNVDSAAGTMAVMRSNGNEISAGFGAF